MATGQCPRRTSGTFAVNRQASQVIMVLSFLPSWYAAEDYYKEQWMTGVAEEDRVNHERTASMNGHRRYRHCCGSQMREVDRQLLQRMQLSGYPQ